ncbi:MAG: hypothetical protein ACR2PQ_05930 [Myxococcota bacterium]
MDAERVLAVSERGIHLLFDNETIAEAFAQDPERLERVIFTEGLELEGVIEGLLGQPTAVEGRRYLDQLSEDLRYILVLVYFERLDRRLERTRVIH